MNTGQIIKSKTNGDFTVIPNEILQTPKLSWKAKGLLAYLISLPASWVCHLKELPSHATDGRVSTVGAFKELQDYGLILSVAIRDAETGRMMGWNHIVYNKVQKAGSTPTGGMEEVLSSLALNNEQKVDSDATDRFTGFPQSGEPIYGKPTPIKETSTRKETSEKETRAHPSDVFLKSVGETLFRDEVWSWGQNITHTLSDADWPLNERQRKAAIYQYLNWKHDLKEIHGVPRKDLIRGLLQWCRSQVQADKLKNRNLVEEFSDEYDRTINWYKRDNHRQ